MKKKVEKRRLYLGQETTYGNGIVYFILMFKRKTVSCFA